MNVALSWPPSPIMGAPPVVGVIPWTGLGGKVLGSERMTRVQDPEERLKALFVAGLDGDAAAYRSALDQLSRPLRAYLRHRLQRLPSDVEDVLQEALLAIHLHRDTFDTSQLLMPWAYAITRHKLIDFLRRHQRLDVPVEPLDESHEGLAVEDDNAHESRRDLGVLLDALPERFRLPIVHTKLEGLSVAETAALTGMSESAIKVGVHRGLKALAALMNKGKP